jgi:hypothetical protein
VRYAVLGSESFGIEEREICGSIGKHFEGRDGRDEGSVSLLQTAITVLLCLRFPCLLRSRDNTRVGCALVFALEAKIEIEANEKKVKLYKIQFFAS